MKTELLYNVVVYFPNGQKKIFGKGNYKESKELENRAFDVYEGKDVLIGMDLIYSSLPKLTKAKSEQIDRDMYEAVTTTRRQTRQAIFQFLLKSIT